MRRSLAILATALFLGAACRGEGPGDAEEPASGEPQVTVWFQGALSGDFRSLVTPAFQGAQMRIEELNGDEAFPAVITLARADTQGDRVRAPSVAEEVAGDEGTVAVIGPAFSG
jgi:branched-chain amino acid transport system substrate-binding protein